MSSNGKYKTKGIEIDLPSNKLAANKLLRALYLENDGLSHADKLKRIAKMTGRNYTSLYRTAKQQKWSDDLVLYASEGVTAEQVDAATEYADSHGLSYDPTKVLKAVSFERIGKDVKAFGFMMVNTSKEVASVGAMMINFYAGKIKETIRTAGGLQHIDKIDEMKIKGYEEKLSKYQTLIQEYLKPASVARYLQMVGIEDALTIIPDDVDVSAFTPARLQEALAANGMMNIIGDANLIAEVARDVGMELPEIEATKVRDEANNIGMN